MCVLFLKKKNLTGDAQLSSMTSKGILKSVFGSTAQGDGQLDTDWVILSCQLSGF